MAKLIKVDRNGSRHYEGLVTCTRCGGTGYYALGTHNGAPRLSPYDGGMCWECQGKGKIYGTWVERTPEYQAKLDARRQKRREAAAERRREMADGINCAFLEKHGFSPDGITYAVLGDTRRCGAVLRDLGCVWAESIGWHTDHPLDGYHVLAVSVDECCVKDDADGTYRWRGQGSRAAEKVVQANKALEKHSAYVGTPGEKVAANAVLEHLVSFNGWMGKTVYLYIFRNDAGNMFVWKTQSPQSIDEGCRVRLSGTVKEHCEYKGEKQTVLTRCRIAAEDGE